MESLILDHARSLITLPENKAIELAEIAKKRKLTVRQLEKLSRATKMNKSLDVDIPVLAETETSITLTFKTKQEKEKFARVVKKHYGN